MGERDEEITKFLSEIFVEKRGIFQQMVSVVNLTLQDTLKIEYQYSYDEFCSAYLKNFLLFFERHPDVDFLDNTMVSFYTNIILGELLLEIKTKTKK